MVPSPHYRPVQVRIPHLEVTGKAAYAWLRRIRVGGRKKYNSIKPSAYFFINLPLCRCRSPFTPSASIVNARPCVVVPPLPLHSSPPSPPPPLLLTPSPSSSSSQPTFPRRRHLCHHHHCCRRCRRCRHHNRRHRLRHPFHRCRRRRRRRRCGCRRRKAQSHRRCTSTAAATAKPHYCNMQQPPSATSELHRSAPQSSNATAAPPFPPHFHPFDYCVLIFLQKFRGVVDSNL